MKWFRTKKWYEKRWQCERCGRWIKRAVQSEKQWCFSCLCGEHNNIAFLLGATLVALQQKLVEDCDVCIQENARVILGEAERCMRDLPVDDKVSAQFYDAYIEVKRRIAQGEEQR